MAKIDENLGMLLLLLACGNEMEFNSEQKMNFENLENSLLEDKKVQKTIKEYIITSLIMSKDFYLENEFNDELKNPVNKYLIEATNISIAYNEYLKEFKDFFCNYHKLHGELMNNVSEFAKWVINNNKTEIMDKLIEYKLDIVNQGFGGLCKD